MIDEQLSHEEALAKVRAWLSANNLLQDPLDDFPTWAESRFYVPDKLHPVTYEPLDERGLIILTPHQRTITRYMLDWTRPLEDTFQTLVYCMAPETRVLTRDLLWVPVGDLQVGQGIVGFDENTPEGKGYNRKFRYGEVTSTGRVNAPCRRITFDDGRELTASLEHPWLARRYPRTNANVDWRLTRDLQVGDRLPQVTKTWDVDYSYSGGYVAAALDGEGNLGGGSSAQCLSFAQKDNAMLRAFVSYLDELGIKYAQYEGGKLSRVRVVRIPTRSEALYVLGSLRPKRLLDRVNLDGVNMTSCGDATVVAIEECFSEVVTLSTSTSTYVAEGFGVHNSTPKKEGKTTVAAAVARFVAERWGDYSDVIMVGNDVEQARSRIYDAAIRSMELDPRWNRQRRELMADDGTTEWRMVRSLGDHIPNWGKIRPIALDYRGEAGANPTASVWTEVWGADQEKARRLFDELTPPPTRQRSIRFLEGYAGFEGESILWREIWDRAQKEGRRVTREELVPYGGWPFPDDPPLWINPTARLCAYIDQGIPARRMPWKRGERGRLYYSSQEATERPDAYRRLHLNEWVSSVTEFIPYAWWHACRETESESAVRKVSSRLLSKEIPIVIGADAAVTGDCAAIVGVCRHPDDPQAVSVLFVKIWTPTPGHPLDYSSEGGIEDELRRMCQQYNVVQIAYDPYQLHHLMTNMGREGYAWCRPFGQTMERGKADKQLYDLIRTRRVKHPGFMDLDEHIKHAAAKHAPDDDTKLRIIKKSQALKIDSVVALSMAASECLRLNLT